ncbi:tetratricopeptide repeat protein [Pedobacter cryophilus]|uniref:Tetratricopeptide repeat protein n=1 Tax=Pedobacter cryophilus TaxID=2571271 RepID=A0A4U1BT44_9SPHI|nr:tetratricopeptide repeat protein [Pedobacter cryophilus]
MKYYLLLFFCLNLGRLFAYQTDNSLLGLKSDTNTVNELNKLGYNNRLTDPEQTIITAKKAIKIAADINYNNGLAESNRVLGIGYYYLNQRDTALNYYLTALNLFKKNANQLGEAKVSNNIGNLWLDIDYDKALNYFENTLKIAQKYNIKELIAGSYLNIGNTFSRKKNYNFALSNYEKSSQIFNEINNPVGITQSLQNRGVIYFSLNQFNEAEKLLLEANKKAKEFELNGSVASINLTLTSIYIARGAFDKAEEFLKEGVAFSKLVNDEKRLYDYTFTSYELEFKRKNYQKAISYLKEVHEQDSVNFKRNIASNINLIQETLKQQQQQKENELTIANQRNANTLFIASAIVAILSFFVIFLLIRINKKSSESNKALTSLNQEVSFQKDNVDRINQKLEEIITERTKDLIYKNQKLSEYSSHLSHQIRGPVATLKGLVMLILGNMVESKDVIPQIKKCVDEIDDQIMDINQALHDPTRLHLHSK